MTDKDELKKIGIDYDDGVKRFMGDAEMYEKFLRMFKTDESFEQLDEAMTAGNYHEAFLAAHTLKGVTGNLSMQKLYEELSAFVEMLRNDKDIAQAVKVYPSVKEQYETVMKGINTLL